ncbi:hypothetical protein CDAR_309291 [Caerostris darwini]|uniref:Uncharacterized protein n=1 Tax=Caerostris darwini TaxID=1538125 RepID=A0AAV4WNN8_9ARAC|nr:hypothetical protein CDAR_309291 [Caerostris darwini]
MSNLKANMTVPLRCGKSKLIEKRASDPVPQSQGNLHQTILQGDPQRQEPCSNVFMNPLRRQMTPRGRLGTHFLLSLNSPKKDIASDFVFGHVFRRSRTFAEMEKRYFFTVEIEKSFARRQKGTLGRFLSHFRVSSSPSLQEISAKRFFKGIHKDKNLARMFL